VQVEFLIEIESTGVDDADVRYPSSRRRHLYFLSRARGRFSPEREREREREEPIERAKPTTRVVLSRILFVLLRRREREREKQLMSRERGKRQNQKSIMETHQKQESEREKREKREKREEREKREKRVSAGGHLFRFDLEQKKKSVSQISSPLFFILPSNKFLPFCPNIE